MAQLIRHLTTYRGFQVQALTGSFFVLFVRNKERKIPAFFYWKREVSFHLGLNPMIGRLLPTTFPFFVGVWGEHCLSAFLPLYLLPFGVNIIIHAILSTQSLPLLWWGQTWSYLDLFVVFVFKIYTRVPISQNVREKQQIDCRWRISVMKWSREIAFA